MDQIKRAIITEYWVKKLSGELPKTSLPVAAPWKVEKTLEPNNQSIQCEIPQPLAEKLLKSSKNSDIALFILFLSGINIVLGRYAGSDDVVVGTLPPAADGDDGSIIFCRIRISDGVTVKESIMQTRDEVLEAMKFKGFSLDEIVEVLRVKNNTDSLDIFNAAFLYEPFQMKNKSIDRFGLVLILTNQKNRLVLQTEDLSSCSSIEILTNLSQNVITTLDRMLENTSIEISMLDILNFEEKNRLLYDFNKTEAEYPRDKTIHRLFAEQVLRTPNHIAVVGASIGMKHWKSLTSINAASSHFVQISYLELHEKSNRLSCRFKEKGVGPDVTVGIMVERSIEMIIGILGILKAGGAYLPIDTDYPQERIDFMLKDSGAKWLITIGALVEEGEKVRRWEGEKILLEENREVPKSNSYPLTLLPSYLQSSSTLAYIIYTSGSTGKPKGVLIEHKNVVRLLFSDKFQFDFNDQDVWTLFHSYSFDFSVWEMYGALLYGGKLIAVPRMVSIDSREFLSLLEKEFVSVLNQTPSAFYNLIELNLSIPGDRRHLNIKYIIFGGEALKPGKLESWRECYPGAKFINMFGITETTVHVTYKEISKNEIALNRSNIGKPIPTLMVYILDNQLRPVPVGVLGEIYVGGLGVGRGYLNRAELTSSKFIENPYKEFDRLYRSGDLGRYIEGGDIEYLGRIDQQVKIRGFRIELGEIENELLRHREIRDAVVTAKEKGFEKYLCAYIVSEKGLVTSGLRAFLAGNLPDYMIPSHFVQVEKIPLTTNGKVDTKSLEQVGKRLEIGTAYSAPQNTIERKIAETWKQVLGLDNVGVHDNYFELGGTSFDILRINAQLKESLQADIPVVVMFTYPTVHLLSEYLMASRLQDKAQKIRDRSTVLERGKIDRREQFQRRKGTSEPEKTGDRRY